MAININGNMANKASVFPASKLGSKSKLLTENRLTSLIYNLLDIDCYVNLTENLSTNIDLGNVIYNSNDNVSLIPINTSNDFKLFCTLHGYQIDAGNISELNSLIYNARSTFGNNFAKLRVSIYIDETDEDYSELYGEDSVEKSKEFLPSTLFDSLTPTTESGISGWKIKDDYLGYFTSCKSITVKVDDLTYDLNLKTLVKNKTTVYYITSTDISTLSDSNTITVKYYDYSAIISFDVIQVTGDSDDSVEVPSGLSTITYKTYYLDVLYANSSGKLYLPLPSLFKFNSTSVKDIDGGII